MRLWNFFHILGMSLALAGYAAWIGHRENTPSVPATDISLLSPVQAEALWKRDTTLFIDVRSRIDYSYGHIAGAICLPPEELENQVADLTPRLHKAQALVVYCKSVDCGQSLWSALRLRQLGFSQVTIFPAGWNEWHHRGLPSHHTAAR